MNYIFTMTFNCENLIRVIFFYTVLGSDSRKRKHDAEKTWYKYEFISIFFKQTTFEECILNEHTFWMNKIFDYNFYKTKLNYHMIK